MRVLIDDRIQDYTPEQIAQWMDELPEWRRKQALAFKHDAGQRQSLLAYRLLCQGLREAYAITEQPTFVYGAHGKPYLQTKNPSRPHFSLSHCREAVACVIDESPCGIDIECTERKVTDSIIRYSMDETEQALIRQSDNPRHAFLRLWTRKEAVAKLLGTGLQANRMKDLLTSGHYHIETREAERWVMSVASGMTRLAEYEPTLDVESEMGTIDLFDYLE